MSLKKVNHFYIDETGGIKNSSDFYVMGCVRTDTPEQIEKAFTEILDEFTEEPFFWDSLTEIEKQGIHATANHPDVRTAFYKKLPFLNFRSYFVILDKRGEFYTKLRKNKTIYEIYGWMVKKLIADRIRNNTDKNIFHFEEYTLEGGSQRKALTDLFAELNVPNASFDIVSKSTKNLGIVDYMNYLIHSILKDPKDQQPGIKKTFKMLASQIGLLVFLNTNTFLNRQTKIELDKINKILAGEQP